MPAPTYDQEAMTISATSLTFTNNPPAGAAILLCLYNGTFTPSGCGATWTEIDTGGTLKVFLGTNCSGSAKVISWTGGSSLAKAVSFAGATVLISPLDVITYVSNAGTATATPAYANCAAVGFYIYTDFNGILGEVTTGGLTTKITTLQVSTTYLQTRYTRPATGGTAYSMTGVYDSLNMTQVFITVILLRGAGTVLSSLSATLAATGGMAGAVSNVVPDVPFPIELRAYAGNAPTGPPIMTFPTYRELQWVDEYNALGSGRFTLDLNDSFFAGLPSPLSTYVAQFNLCRVFMGAFDVFDFWIESPTWDIASPDGPAGEAVEVAGRGMEAYLERAIVWTGGVNFTGATAGQIMEAVIDAAQARGAVSLLAPDFSSVADSYGNPWTGPLTGITLSITEGTNLLAVLGSLRQLGVIARLRGDFVLQMWNADPGADLTGDVVIRPGAHISDRVRWQTPVSAQASVMLAAGSVGSSQVVVDGSSTMPDRFEGYVKGPETTDATTLQKVATSEIAKRKVDSESIVLPVFHDSSPGQYEPYRNYGIGDLIGLHTPPTFNMAAKRVAGIMVTSADAALYDVRVSLTSLPIDPTVNSLAAIAKLQLPRAT